MAEEQRYLAYLVRLWTVHDNGDVVWRASVEDAHTGERRAFADLDGLVEFLQATVTDAPPIVYSRRRTDDVVAQ